MSENRARIACLRGPGHVIAYLSDPDIDSPGRDVIGVPMVEAYLQPEYRPYHRAVHATWVDGRTREFDIGGGTVIVMPWLDAGQQVGVTTVFRPALPVVLAPVRPLSDPLAIPEAVSG